MKALLIGAAVAAAGPAHAETFHLLCLGAGSANKPTSQSAYVTGSNGNSAWGQVMGTKDVAFQDQVNIEIVDGVGKIRMPRTMLPNLRGGKDGWMEMENLKVGEREITANATMNFINSPKVRIDRMTGMLNISGKSGNFTAQCKPYDPATEQRAF
jgi:hypothetical protein